MNEDIDALHLSRLDGNESQTQTIVTGLTAISILRLRNAHSIYLGAGATLAAVVGELGVCSLYRDG